MKASAALIGTDIKVVGKSGQISLGKNYAGKTLRLERRDDGTIVLTAGAWGAEESLLRRYGTRAAPVSLGRARHAADGPAAQQHLFSGKCPVQLIERARHG